MNRPLKVLHVDDDPEMLALSAAAFRQLDAVSFLTAETATEALDVIAAESVDCVVSDSLVLPNGVPLVKAVRQEHADIPILLFTAKEWPEVADVASTAGVTEYVQKAGPGDLATVLQRVRGIVDDDSADSALAVGASAVTQALEDHADAAAEATFGLDDNWELVGQWFGDEELGIVIVEAVESYGGLSAIETPLYEYIDTDALEELLRPVVEDEERPGVEVRFPYEDVQVAVTSTGDIFARPTPEHTLS
ncbi:response regulator [Haloferax volcanii]|uniref:Receiver box response regulator / HalOD1 domain protein n=3 Tax=Haloferax volcanii TaxID=2246 RepID=D4GWD4_HALVD|nr:HalOD1 output domain-containing protein [Haloferax volcanii]ADE02288.1 receiver box response regulator / HalOD1 domain protein [Haloferax volcanii DS2]ELY33101.1 HTR-like protein [Haloferax volcanii DS2]MBS8120587.1 response regulator [Haloferax volcanii]MBS8125624.1 response regulator [Haloferax volcanii]MBS8129633.1 response regulator [Haloferax volcanii]